MSSSTRAVFFHRNWTLDDDTGKLSRRPDAPPFTSNLEEQEEIEEVLLLIARYVEEKLQIDYHFVAIPVYGTIDEKTIRASDYSPESMISSAYSFQKATELLSSASPTSPTSSPPVYYTPTVNTNTYSTVLASPNWEKNSKLLIIIQNASNSHIGIYSRSMSLSDGLKKGTWLPYIDRAIDSGYSVMLLRPNTNSILINEKNENGEIVKVKAPIPGSSSPEEHIHSVWKNIILPARNIKSISLLSYGNGAILCKDLISRELVDIMASNSPQSRSHANLLALNQSVPEPVLLNNNNISNTSSVSSSNSSSTISSSSFSQGTLPISSLDSSTSFSLYKQARPRIQAFISIEASQIIERDDPSDVREVIDRICINLEACEAAPSGVQLDYRKKLLGCHTLSLGYSFNLDDKSSIISTAMSVPIAIDNVFKYLIVSEGTRNTVAKNFITLMIRDYRLDSNELILYNPPNNESDPNSSSSTTNSSNLTPISSPASSPIPQPKIVDNYTYNSENHTSTNNPSASPSTNTNKTSSNKSSQGFLSRFFSRNKNNSSNSNSTNNNSNEISIKDFDLLKIIGKGAFGKVILVKKITKHNQNSDTNSNKVYAMKVLKKDLIAAKGQIEQTKTERDILFEVSHPFIVKLRYAFQSEDRLYIITDYYNGGNLYYHLHKEKNFSEEKTKFYIAELILVLSHLHSYGIIYRDLKLENILLDFNGHIILTDFGLSKKIPPLIFNAYRMNPLNPICYAKTFCGTAEYIAPELLQGLKYGPAIDWWSLGILFYEMIHGKTPFLDKNRKLMFYKILNTRPVYNELFSPSTIDLINNFLTIKDIDRWGCGYSGYGNLTHIKEHKCFESINFDLLLKKKLVPPFLPNVESENDIKYVSKKLLEAEVRVSDSHPSELASNPHTSATSSDKQTNMKDSSNSSQSILGSFRKGKMNGVNPTVLVFDQFEYSHE